MARNLGYCGTRSVVGKAAADRLCGRTVPDGIDMDHLADQELVANIAAEEAVCDDCEDRRCEDKS